MATLKALIRKDKVNKEGIAKVQIAICHHKQTAYIPTDIKVVADNFIGGKLVSGTGRNNINAEIAIILQEYKTRLSEIENVDARTCVQIKDILVYSSKSRYHKVSECFGAFMSQLKSENSKVSYRTSYKCFLDFTKNNDVNIESVDTFYIRKYEQWLKDFVPYRTQQGRNVKPSNSKKREWQKLHPQSQHYSQATIATYLAHLKSVINWCISEGWVTYSVHPFSKTEISTREVRQNILSLSDFKKIKNYKATNMRYKRCHDIFMLSFYLGGANLADIVRFDFRGREITFERQKIASRTKGTAKVTIPILPEAREIVNRYMDSEGRLELGKTVKQLISEFNYCIKCIAMELDITSLITFTSARKAVAQIGTDLGISDNYLNYLLGHSMSKARGMMNPYSQMESRMAGEILKTIVKMADHPDKIEEVFAENLNKILSKVM